MLIYFDANMWAECAARPMYRSPPLEPGIVDKMLEGIFLARGAKPCGSNKFTDLPVEGDLICLNDAGKSTENLLAFFRQASKSKTTIPHYISHKVAVIPQLK